VFNIQEKITVHFHTRVYIYTQDKYDDNIVSGYILGEGTEKPPPHQLRGLGECCKAEPRRPTDFSHFGVPRTALLRNMRPLSMREAPHRGVRGAVLPPALNKLTLMTRLVA